MRKYALWFFRQMSAVRGRLLLRIIAGLLQVALGLWLVWLCRRFIDVVIWRGNVLRETIVLFSVIALLIALRQLVFYLSGITDHHVADDGIVDHIVKLVEAKAAEIEAAKLAAEQAQAA